MTMVAAMSSRWRHARAGSGRFGESGRGEEEDAVTMSAAMLLHGGAAADDAWRAGGGRCYIGKGADDNGKRRERASDDGSAV